MPKPKIDWNLAQALFLQGLTVTAIANRFGLATASVSKQSAKRGWLALRSQTESNLARPMENSLAVKVATASNTVRSKMAERLVSLSDRLPTTPQSLKTELRLQRELESAVRNAERIFGWSSENGSALVRTSLLQSAVIDITPKKEIDPIVLGSPSDGGTSIDLVAPSDGGNSIKESILSADTSLEPSTGETL